MSYSTDFWCIIDIICMKGNFYCCCILNTKEWYFAGQNDLKVKCVQKLLDSFTQLSLLLLHMKEA